MNSRDVRLEERAAAPRQPLCPGPAAGRRRELRGAALVAPQQRPRARREDLEVERLAEVIVGPLGEPLDLGSASSMAVSIRIELREALLARPAADVQAVAVGEPAVEHEQVIVVEGQELLGLGDRDASSQASPSRVSVRTTIDRSRIVLQNQRSHPPVSLQRGRLIRRGNPGALLVEPTTRGRHPQQ